MSTIQKNSLFTEEDERKFIQLIHNNQIVDATNLVFCGKIDKMSKLVHGKKHLGNCIEVDEFVNNIYIDLSKYLTESTDYMQAEHPLGYVINHVRKYFLIIDSKETKNVRLLQDTRYAGSQNIPYRYRKKGTSYEESKVCSYENILAETPEGETSQVERAATDEQETVSTTLTKDKIYRYVYGQIADIGKTIDVFNSKENEETEELFLTKAEKEN